MSILTDDSCKEIAIQPSLVYPSLPKYNHHFQNSDEDRQTCIHFASKLIKLRSELRSPSYMRSTNTNQPVLSRVLSLPNVNQYQQDSIRDDDDQSLITYITDETSLSIHTRRRNNHYLALPPITKRSMSLREVSRPIKNENRYTIGFKNQLLCDSSEIISKEKKEEAVIIPTPSHSSKSLYSAMSSDSEDELNNKSIIKTRTTAFFVSLSPCSAAAASVAKWKRRNIRKANT